MLHTWSTVAFAGSIVAMKLRALASPFFLMPEKSSIEKQRASFSPSPSCSNAGRAAGYPSWVASPSCLQVMDALPLVLPLPHPWWGTFSGQVGRSLLLSGPGYLSVDLCLSKQELHFHCCSIAQERQLSCKELVHHAGHVHARISIPQSWVIPSFP